MRDDIRGIVFIGEPGSGKSSISEELMKMLDWDRLSFAASLKSQVAAGLSCIVSDDVGWAKHLDNMADPVTKDSYRPLLQAWGSFRRLEDYNYWVKRVELEMVDGEHYVIDDCRYFNEYEFLLSEGFKFVKLLPGETTRRLTGEQAEHESERDWPNFGIDLFLTYELGPRHQAERVASFFGLGSFVATDLDDCGDTNCSMCYPKEDHACNEDCGCECDCDICQESQQDDTVFSATPEDFEVSIKLHSAPKGATVTFDVVRIDIPRDDPLMAPAAGQ